MMTGKGRKRNRGLPPIDKETSLEDDNREPSGTITELSGTSSTSSVVNTAVESPASSELEFFRRVYSSPAVYTHQLFPMTGGMEREVEVIGFGSSHKITSNNQQWLNLSVSGSGLGFETEPPVGAKQQVKRSRRGPRSRSSQYRGVTFYRRTGRWESHIWDCGKQVYLGGFDTAHTAARAYDRAAIQFRGVDADINFTIADYEEDMKQTKNLNKEEFVQILRRHSNGFARGKSRNKGATLHKCGRWEARMGQLVGQKASTYEGHLQLQPNNIGGTGGDHNLDLNLGISMSINGPKESNNLGVPYSPIPLANGKSSLENDAKLEGVSSQNFSNWAWQTPSQGPGGGGGGEGDGVTTKQQQWQPVWLETKISAASSGFYSSPSADYNNTILPFTNPNNNYFITPNYFSSFRPYAQNK